MATQKYNKKKDHIHEPVVTGHVTRTLLSSPEALFWKAAIVLVEISGIREIIRVSLLAKWNKIRLTTGQKLWF